MEADSIDVRDYCSGRQQWYNQAAATYARCMEIEGAIGLVEFRRVRREANDVSSGTRTY